MGRMDETKMKQALIGLAALVAGCATGLTGENTARLCNGAKVDLMDYGFKVTKGNSEFMHFESNESIQVPYGCNNILNQRKEGNIYIEIYEDNGCNGFVDLFYREFTGNRREPIVQMPAGSAASTKYYSEFFAMNIPEAQTLWEEWRKLK